MSRTYKMKKKIIFVIFGATGDLAKRKLFPSISYLEYEKKLYDIYEVVGVARTKLTQESFKKRVQASVEEFSKDNLREGFLDKFSYFRMDYQINASFQALKQLLEKKADGFISQVIFYFSLPPFVFLTILKKMQKTNFASIAKTKVKIIFEKPFGINLESAKELNENLVKIFDEKQIYRIDHYLGKEAVQNFLILRFSNHFLASIWNKQHIDNVQITVAETLGVEDRASYYDNSGAMRDMMQNHLFQMLSHIAMEPPSSLDPEAIRDEKVKVLNSIKNIDPTFDTSVIFGQYEQGEIDGKPVSSYVKESGVDKKSRTETFAAMEVHIENWRWNGVPFFLRTGKRLAKRAAYIVVEFKKVPKILYNRDGTLQQNKLIIMINPDETIKMEFNVKKPDSVDITPIQATFDHKDFFHKPAPEAYEKLLLDVIRSDQTHFRRWDIVYNSWRIVDNIVDCTDNCPMTFPYRAGTMGPPQADELLHRSGRSWFNL